MNGVTSTVRRVKVAGAEDDIIINGRLGDLLVEYVPANNGSKYGELWLGTNGWKETGAWVTIDGLRSLLAKLEKRANSR